MCARFFRAGRNELDYFEEGKKERETSKAPTPTNIHCSPAGCTTKLPVIDCVPDRATLSTLRLRLRGFRSGVLQKYDNCTAKGRTQNTTGWLGVGDKRRLTAKRNKNQTADDCTS